MNIHALRIYSPPHFNGICIDESFILFMDLHQKTLLAIYSTVKRGEGERKKIRIFQQGSKKEIEVLKHMMAQW